MTSKERERGGREREKDKETLEGCTISCSPAMIMSGMKRRNAFKLLYRVSLHTGEGEESSPSPRCCKCGTHSTYFQESSWTTGRTFFT